MTMRAVGLLIASIARSGAYRRQLALLAAAQSAQYFDIALAIVADTVIPIACGNFNTCAAAARRRRQSMRNPQIMLPIIKRAQTIDNRQIAEICASANSANFGDFQLLLLKRLRQFLLNIAVSNKHRRRRLRHLPPASGILTNRAFGKGSASLKRQLVNWASVTMRIITAFHRVPSWCFLPHPDGCGHSGGCFARAHILPLPCVINTVENFAGCSRSPWWKSNFAASFAVSIHDKFTEVTNHARAFSALSGRASITSCAVAGLTPCAPNPPSLLSAESEDR